MSDHETFNGSTALIVHTLGEIKADVRTIKRNTHETMIVTHVLTQRLDSQQKSSAKDRLLDLSGWLTGVIILILALAGKWNELGVFLAGNGR